LGPVWLARRCPATPQPFPSLGSREKPVLRKTAGGEICSGRTVAREPVLGQGFDALAGAHSQALAKMSGDIAAAIRVEAEQKS
jgi:hypothetical protein